MQHSYRTELANIRQRSNESVRELSERFSELINAIGEDPNSENILFLFRRSLKSKLQSLYACSTHSSPPNTLREAINLAIFIENAEVQEEKPAP